jgi:hypothetical protein
MVKQILVTGFPHSGTTVLRAKIGECKNTKEQSKEFNDVTEFHPNMPYDFYVWKTPVIPGEFRNNTFSVKEETKYKDTIIIPIIRNPWNVFSSLYKRGIQSGQFSIYDNRQLHSIEYYNNACDIIADAFKNNYKNVYPIKYEDMFDNNFQTLKNIFDKIGLQYDDSIFETKTKEYKHNDCEYIDDYDKKDLQDGEYRMWQINQPFKNMNADIILPDDFSQMLANSPNIQKLGYSDPRITD